MGQNEDNNNLDYNQDSMASTHSDEIQKDHSKIAMILALQDKTLPQIGDKHMAVRCCVCKTIEFPPKSGEFYQIEDYDPTHFVFSDTYLSKKCMDYTLTGNPDNLIDRIKMTEMYLNLPESCRKHRDQPSKTYKASQIRLERQIRTYMVDITTQEQLTKVIEQNFSDYNMELKKDIYCLCEAYVRLKSIK